MNPDVADAVASLARDGTLDAAPARLFSRVARRELVSLHGDLRFLAYTGVLLVMGGVGILVKDELDRIGPLAIAAVLALGAAASFAWLARHAPPFTRRAVPSAHLGLDYVLLLGALLVGADLAYVEAQFTPLGAAWVWHLLIAATFYALLAFRYDSRVLFSVALSTFAAWRGVSAGQLEPAVWRWDEGASDVRANAAACGVLFLLLGAVLKRSDWKAHFEPVAVHAGWLLVLSALLSGLGESDGQAQVYGSVLFVVGGGLAAYGLHARRFWLLVMGLLGAYIGVSTVVLSAVDSSRFAVYWFAFSGLAVLPALFLLHRLVKERA